MPKAKKYSAAITLIAFCLSLLLFAPIAKNAWPQDETQIQALINELKDPKPNVRMSAVKALVEIGAPAIPALIKALHDKDRTVRRNAAYTLENFGSEAKAAVPVLIESLKNKDEYMDVYREVADVLVAIGPYAVPALIETLEYPDRVIRVRAASILKGIGPKAKDAVPVLINAIIDEDWSVRDRVKDALVAIGIIALPDLLEALKDKDKGVRSEAANVIGRIGPDAKDAVPDLIEALKDPNNLTRQNAAWALGNIDVEANVVVPELIKALKNPDNTGYTREVIVRALGEFGPEAKAAIPALIEALKNEYEEVRVAAARTLGDIGIGAKPAIPAIIEALEDENENVRRAAAYALGDIGSEAKVALPVLIESLKDENEDVRRVAEWAIKKFSSKATEIRETDSLKELKAARLALSNDPKFSKSKTVQELSRAIEYLELIKPPWWETAWNLTNKNKITQTIGISVSLYIILVIAWLIVFWLRPLALLRINQALKPLDVEIKSIKLPLRFFFFVGFLNYRPRVLDAWGKKYLAAARERFSEKPTVYDRKIHISVPVEFDRQIIPDLTPKQLQPTFSGHIGCLLVWGEGGAGKTSLACQIAKWAMSEDKEPQLCDHLMLPVLIEHEFASKEDPSAFIDAVNRHVQDLTDQANPISEELLECLLRQRRILVIVDHLSEMSKDTRDQIQPEKKGFPANALIVTSRLEEELGGVSKTLIKPLRIKRDRLSPFMEAYLTHRGKSDLFTDSEFHESCRRLTEMVGIRDITLLLSKLYAEQLIASKEGITNDKLPDNIPDLMLSYLNDLNRSITEEKIDDRLVQQSAKTLAWLCLEETFRPGPARIEDALTALDPTGCEAHLDYLEHRLRLVRTILPAKDRLEFVLDPLGEYLAAMYFIEHYGNRQPSWRKFFKDADAKEGAPESIKGFLLAVRDCIIAKGEEAKVPDFVADDLAKRAGLDPKTLEKAYLKQRIQRLINQLGSPVIADRRYSLEALERIGPEAKAAVPALSEVLKDKDKEVRRAAAEALRGIGPEAKAAVPALIEALKDKNIDGRRAAADALMKIGSASVPALSVTLKDENEYVQRTAAGALGRIGPEAKAAVPSLSKALKDKSLHVREAAAGALGGIGPEAKAAVLTLSKALKDKSLHVREAAADALGRIGPDAVPVLIKALKDKNDDVQGGAARALGVIGPEAKAAVPALIEALKKMNYFSGASAALIKIGSASVPKLIDAFKDWDRYDSRMAAQTLRGIGQKAKAAVPVLIEALKDESYFVREDAAQALGAINTPEARKALEEYKKKSDSD